MKNFDQIGEILTVEEVALFLKMTDDEVVDLLEKREIPGVKIGNVWRTTKANLMALFQIEQPVTPSPSDSSPLSDEPKIGELVRSKMSELLNENRIPEDEIKRLKTQSYSKEVFGIAYPLLKEYSPVLPLKQQREVKGYPRYWKSVFANRYLITSEWYDRHHDRFLRWAERY